MASSPDVLKMLVQFRICEHTHHEESTLGHTISFTPAQAVRVRSADQSPDVLPLTCFTAANYDIPFRYHAINSILYLSNFGSAAQQAGLGECARVTKGNKELFDSSFCPNSFRFLNTEKIALKVECVHLGFQDLLLGDDFWGLTLWRLFPAIKELYLVYQSGAEFKSDQYSDMCQWLNMARKAARNKYRLDVDPRPVVIIRCLFLQGLPVPGTN